MKAAGQISKERFLARAALADERAMRAREDIEKKMWEDIAESWRQLARQYTSQPSWIPLN